MLKWLFKKQNAALIEYVKGLEEQLKRTPQFTTLPVPEGEKLQAFLSDLGKSNYFMFYLHAIENELISSFTSGKESEIYKGGLKVIERIKKDIFQAVRNVETKRVTDAGEV